MPTEVPRVVQCLACLYDRGFNPKSSNHMWTTELRKLKALQLITNTYEITHAGIQVLKKAGFPGSAQFGKE